MCYPTTSCLHWSVHSRRHTGKRVDEQRTPVRPPRAPCVQLVAAADHLEARLRDQLVQQRQVEVACRVLRPCRATECAQAEGGQLQHMYMLAGTSRFPCSHIQPMQPQRLPVASVQQKLTGHAKEVGDTQRHKSLRQQPAMQHDFGSASHGPCNTLITRLPPCIGGTTPHRSTVRLKLTCLPRLRGPGTSASALVCTTRLKVRCSRQSVVTKLGKLAWVGVAEAGLLLHVYHSRCP